MQDVAREAGISTTGQRDYHLLRHAGLNGVICFGPMHDKQQTFVLLDEWTTPSKGPTGDEAVAELAVRYFQSHGPATPEDFAWWSGLGVRVARAGVRAAIGRLHEHTINDTQTWSGHDIASVNAPAPSTFLLPAFDEYYLGYRDRSAVLDPAYDSRVVSHNGVFRPIIVVDGQVAGIWKQEAKRDAITLALQPFLTLGASERRALDAAAQQYAAYLGRPVAVEQPPD